MKAKQHNAICPMIIPAHKLPCALDGDRPSDRRVVHGRSVTVAARGIIPKKTAVATHSNAPTTTGAKFGVNTRRSASSLNKKLGTICAVHVAKSVPTAPPAREIVTLSDKSSAAYSLRDAPSATRREVSWERFEALAVSKEATLVQASTNTAAAASVTKMLMRDSAWAILGVMSRKVTISTDVPRLF